MSTWRWTAILALLFVSCAALLAACSQSSTTGPITDAAKKAGRDVASFPMSDDPYFNAMDGGVALSRDETIGRNMWLVWSAGNDRFWDEFSRSTFGGFDLLKIVSRPPGRKATIGRADRWSSDGLINEPCYTEAVEKDRYGLWFDVRDPACGPDPFDDPEKFPGVVGGALDKTSAGSFYGRPTGIVGLRLFPNPDFDATAEKNWKADDYYKLKECGPSESEKKCDQNDFDRKQRNRNMIRPYRVGMTCAFCHVSFNPNRPPRDPANPQWSELSSNVGAQFMRVKQVFLPNLDEASFLSQIIGSYRQGSLDTSLAGTDSINNPRTMNAIYELEARLALGSRLGEEKLTPEQFKYLLPHGPLTANLFKAPDTVFTPHILKDGADSAGPLTALNRVYVNIGMFSEEWTNNFNPVIGGKEMTPFMIEKAQANSVYWQVTEANTPNLAKFFLRIGKPHHLEDTDAGRDILSRDAAETVERGKAAFAGTCARCHSSVGPPAPDAIKTCREHKDYLACFKDWWRWTQTDDYKRAMTAIVKGPNFTKGNYLSTDVRVPLTLLRTNACSPLATNATAGKVWDNFSSQTYKELPPVGKITVRDPFTGEHDSLDMPGGGRGYTRPPSLISLWSTAPFLLNNTVGEENADPSIAARVGAYDRAMRELLLLEPRDPDGKLADKGVGKIARTTRPSFIFFPQRYVPNQFRYWPRFLSHWWPEFFSKTGDVTLGPLPKDLPVNLIANFRLVQETPRQRLDFLISLARLVPGLIKGMYMVAWDEPDAKFYEHYANLAPALLRMSNCRDFEINRGHYFGTAEFNRTEGLTDDEKAWGTEPALSDDDKRALIAYLKTF